MPVQIRPARALQTLRKSNAPIGEVSPDNQLSSMDQAMFALLRAMDRAAVVQCVWVYEHPVNFEALKRFHHHLGCGLLGRRIERSPLPFARHRWVCDRGPAEMEVAESPRPRGELSDWIDERAQEPIDPEQGPAWHLGVLPLTDGSTAVSLVASHCLIDGLGIGLAVAEAAIGKTRNLGYPPPHSRTRLRALAQDARQTVRGAPEVGRAFAGAARAARRRRHEEATAAASTPSRSVAAGSGYGDERVVVPAIAIHVDLDQWDERASALGGTSHHLAAGLAAKLGERMGRGRAGNGTVTLQVPLSDRTEDDARANTLSFVSVSVDPSRVTTDLSHTRAAIKRVFNTLRETPEVASPMLPLAPLVPYVPKRALKRLAEAAFGYDDLPVACSSLGDLAAVAACPDGTEAEYAFGGGVIQRVTREHLERHGELSLVFVRISGKMCITVVAYQAGEVCSKPQLRELAARTLAEFDLSGVIE
ncbi:hypothetical protein LAUMK35_04326 [Mycobacterium pseudokansasii]|uniref:Diacylglycerol O-acyltransferase n=2 Tax=Mycobacterium pseudokansasii TaxID=2341080 RepID=A0A498QVX2_9MYCO|nr:hypothetical protein A4G27_06725 [Mycobacterium kansasii]VAZ99409.1 hypothetical protein LAUMK35_04326 [Mycobacterium pseudokansasii]VBA30650.1 hypothetical protein LAUMK21_04320 [Mycobacterium pseudokansasii]VBA53683.1 hypothetical protein LAUMK142_04219 [Mycobacterium pseudokansasii]